MALSPRNRHHAMAVLASLAKFQGQYDQFRQLKHSYNLKWSSGQESLQSFSRFFNDELSPDSMLQKVSQMIAKTPSSMAQIIKFCCFTGLRPAEAVESVRLINEREGFAKYYNPERQALEHFRFPDVILRQTKKAYISFITPDMFNMVQYTGPSTSTPTYNAIG